jgi:hypothetical protein
MISREKFVSIKEKYGYWGSWAVWQEVGATPKSNVGDLSIFDGDDVLKLLKPEVILVGLNISRNDVQEPFANFHSAKPQAQEYKLRFALKDTPFWGGYLTDIIKEYDEIKAINVLHYLDNNKQFEAENIRTFRQEIDDLGCQDPTIVALGNAAHKIILRNCKDLKIIKIRHFSDWAVSKEKYREEVLKVPIN